MRKRLNLGPDSDILVFLNGHGGDNYWKIQDTYAITDYDFAMAIEELHKKNEFVSFFLHLIFVDIKRCYWFQIAVQHTLFSI
jgi:glycosylphosphatidylinositol transamidase (GPIT) subunit GPI8